MGTVGRSERGRDYLVPGDRYGPVGLRWTASSLDFGTGVFTGVPPRGGTHDCRGGGVGLYRPTTRGRPLGSEKKSVGLGTRGDPL